jgi:hypothetical protein
MFLALSADQLAAIHRAASPLDRSVQDDFIQAVATTLERSCPVLGDGVVHRVLAETQRRYFAPPARTNDTRAGHYGKRRKAD